MKLTSPEFLSSIEARSTCPNCNCSRKYFCYDCRLLMPTVSSFAPKEVHLPAAVDIVKHPGEKNGKCTGVHCVLTAPSFVRLYDFPEFPDYRQNDNTSGTVLIYPDKKAISIAEYVEQFGQINRFVFLDCTWGQAARMRRDERLSGLPVVRLNSYRTQYWRPQKGHTEEDLATVEAVYYAMREYRHTVSDLPYDGDFDDLLFWFDHFHRLVHDGRGVSE